MQLKEGTYCRSCDGRKHKIIAKLRGASIARCSNCDLTFVIRGEAVSSGNDYFGIYDLEKYVAYYQRFRSDSFRRHLDIIEQLVPKGAILDIGCSFGWFLKMAKDRGWQPVGLEHSESAAKTASRTLELNVICGDVGAIDRCGDKFQAITLWNSLEHMPDPANAIRILHDKLSADGILVIAVPNIGGLFSRLSFLLYRLSLGKLRFSLEQLYQVNNPHMHLFHFSENTLCRMLKNRGFEIVKTVKQQVIDAKNIRERIDMDESLKKRSSFSKAALTCVARLIFYLSEVTNLQDEIVVYAKKAKTV